MNGAAEPWDAIVSDETSVGAALFAERGGVARATVAVLPLNMQSPRVRRAGWASRPAGTS